ncbi:MAG: fibronectin type III domain-containing protein [Verrucomicrobia bacterium]|nr:fibronectin type III domain-containing protein [Verrucomicrobiota bacterium]
MSKFKRDLKNDPIPDKTTRGDQIITASTGNAALGTIATELADFVTKNGKLLTDYNLANGSQAQTTHLVGVQNDSNGEWDVSYENLLVAIEKNTHGAKAIMDTTTVPTFEPGVHGPAPTPTKPTGLTVSRGDTTTALNPNWNGQNPHPRVFIIRMCEEPYLLSKMQQVGTSTASDYVKEGLTSGTKYWFDVIAVGSGGRQSPPSDPISGTAG